MIRYNKGRLYAGSVSFALPDNCLLVIAEALNYFDNGLEITSEDESFHITISTQWEDMDAKSFLDNMLMESGFCRLSDTCPIMAGELAGYYVLYEDTRNRYCEYRFDIQEKDDMNTLVIYICTSKTDSVEEITTSTMTKELLASLKSE